MLKFSIVMSCYVMWNLFTFGSLQFCSDSTIAPLEASKTDQRYNIMEINKTSFDILRTLKFKTIILICVHTKTLKFHKSSVEQGLKTFILV